MFSDNKILLRFAQNTVNYDSWYHDANEAFDVLETWTDEYELADFTEAEETYSHAGYYINKLRYAKYIRTVKPHDRHKTPYKKWLKSLPSGDFFAIK